MTNLGNGKKESRFESLLVAQKGENAHWSLVRFEISLAHWSLMHCKCANGILKVTQYLISLFVNGRILLQNGVCIMGWGDSWQHVQSGQTRASELHSNRPSSIEPHQLFVSGGLTSLKASWEPEIPECDGLVYQVFLNEVAEPLTHLIKHKMFYFTAGQFNVSV